MLNVKKKVLVLLMLAYLSFNLSAQENSFTFRPFFGGGGFSGVIGGAGDYGTGGVGEFAFLYFDNGFQMGGHLIGRGDNINTESLNNYGAGSIVGKLSFGGFSPNQLFRGYTFFEGGVGFAGNNNISTQNLIFGGGGGLDLFYHKTGSIYLELGYLQHYVRDELMGGISISIGTRGYFR